jgi:2-amino-4-hydroxy-6-hydroxymethyldihydropteridine diphosphokinase
MNVTYLCLGGNIGDRESSLNTAIQKINQEVGQVLDISSIYETEAWGVDNQQAYLNQCIKVETKLSSNDLIKILLSIEKDLGRKRLPSETYEPRTIDIDILLYNFETINEPYLEIPHPRLQLRKFVLIPLNEIATNYLHPLLNKSIFKLLNECQDNLEVKLYKLKK